MKKLLIISLLMFIILTSIFSNILLGVTVTEEGLENSFKKLIEESKNNSTDMELTDESLTMSIDKDKKQIIFSGEDNNYAVYYDLSDNPTFSVKTTVNNTTTYDEWEKKQEEISSLMILYALVADLNGVSIEDSVMYYVMATIGSALSSDTSATSKYYIVDDRETDSADMSVTVNEQNKIQILASEFQNYAVEYVKDVYSSNSVITDSEVNNTFKYVGKVIESSEDSCTIQTDLTIYADADFSKINGYADKLTSDIENSVTNLQQNVNTLTNSISKLPQTGDFLNTKDILYVLIAIATTFLVVLIVKDIKYKNIGKK